MLCTQWSKPLLQRSRRSSGLPPGWRESLAWPFTRHRITTAAEVGGLAACLGKKLPQKIAYIGSSL